MYSSHTMSRMKVKKFNANIVYSLCNNSYLGPGKYLDMRIYFWAEFKESIELRLQGCIFA